jgi:hypothetical protein
MSAPGKIITRTMLTRHGGILLWLLYHGCPKALKVMASGWRITRAAVD